VVIYLGMRVNAPGGLTTLISFGSKIRKSVEAQPDGLLLCQRSLRNPGERSGDLLAGGHQKSRLVAF
jgi:hypothetical protein